VFYRSALVNGKGASSILLSERRALIDEISSDSKPIINAHAQGYYRVNYSPELLTSLLKNGLQQLDVGERLSLLSDRWALTFFGYTPVDDYLKLTELISAEREPEVIAELVKELEYLNAFVEENQRKDFQRLVQSRLAAIAFDLGWKTSPQDSDLRKIARSEVLAALGTIGQDAQTIEEARKLFADYVKDERSVDPDLLDAITSIVAYNGDKDTYSQIERLWRASRTPEVRERNLMALSRFRQPELIERTLKLTLSSEVKLQDSPNLLASVLATESGRSQAWKFIKANWKALKNTYPMPSIPHVVARASLMSTQDELDDLTQFLEDHPIEAGARKVAQTLEHVKNRVNFRRRSGPALSVELSKVVSANR
ncbi:MAG TPA: ERAP1-like C-terminal domain-containing protein, partial [Candidatus Obscuribacterales bacterium]